MSTTPKRILIVAANPRQTNHLHLDKEVRKIEEALERAHKRDQFELVQCRAVTPRDLRLALLNKRPQIVHFCGHGVGDEGLVLENETGEVQFVSTNALVGLFKLFADQVECVLLNACYSEVQAEVIKQHIDYVIGMNQTIGDQTAIEFAASFYDAVGAGKDYEFSFEYACNSILMAGINQADIPILKKKSNSTSLWVHGWVKQNYGDSPTVELDWTQYFNIDTQPRCIADQATWDNILRPSLIQAREKLSQGRAEVTVDIRGRFSLSTAVAIGTVFPHTRGYTLQVEKQNTGQNNLWRSDVSPSDAKFKIVKEDGKVGEHLLIALGISGDPSGELRQLYKDSPIPFSAVVYAEPESGTGERAIGSDTDAIALAIHAKEIIRQYRRKYEATDTHLVLHAPLSFCLFLGQRLRVVGDVICYECVSIKDKKYQPSVKLCTG